MVLQLVTQLTKIRSLICTKILQPQTEKSANKTKRKEDNRSDNRSENRSHRHQQGSFKPTEKKEILRKSDHDKGGRKPPTRDGAPRKQQQGAPPQRGKGAPRKKHVSVEDMSEDDHLNYRFVGIILVSLA